MKQLSCTNLTKSFKDKVVLNDISLTLEPKRIYGLIGRNGAGKTTLLGILSGQNPATSGSISYGGATVWENQRSLNDICFSREITVASGTISPDNRKIKSFLKTAEILLPHWDKEYALSLTNAFKLEPKKPLNKCSKGMLSALTIVVALASKAPVTFLDEPTAGLDVFMRDMFYKLLVEEFTRSGRTFVISTHIIDEASGIFEDVIIIDEGRILRHDNTEELLARHRIVSGKDTDIDEFTKKYRVIHKESSGRSKSVCVEITDLRTFINDVAEYNLTASPVSLQKLFLLLGAGDEGSKFNE